MNYMGKSGSNRNYKPKHNMQRDFYKRPSPERDLRFLEPMPRPKATPQPENINRFERDRQRALDDILQNRKKSNQMGPMSAGVDFGNRRPIYDRNGNLVPQRPVLKDSRTVPVPIMDYVGSKTAQAYKPGYPTEMDYLSDPFREIDPGSLLFPDSPYDNAEEEDMYMDYSRGPLYFG